MIRLINSNRFRISTAFILVHFFSLNRAQTTPDPPSTLSVYAMKMKGVCAKAQFEDEYISTCNNSATSILPDQDSFIFPPQLPISSIIKIQKQNDLIMTELINRAVYNNKVRPHHPRFGFELISTSFAMYGRVCPIVPPEFLQTVYHLYSYLHWKTAHNRKEYISKRHQKWILKLLHNCTRTLKPYKILTDTCKEKVMTMENCTSFICTKAENEFRLMRTDPILDVVFKAMEMIQSVCFPFFVESYHMFHSYHLAVMDTFTEEMKIRWGTQLDGVTYWKRLLGPSLETHLVNIERCNQAIIGNAKFHYRIPRTSLPAKIRLAGRLVKVL